MRASAVYSGIDRQRSTVLQSRHTLPLSSDAAPSANTNAESPMIRKFAQTSLITLAAVLLFTATGAAQTLDASVGYAFRRETDLSVEKGWFGAVGANLNDSFGLFGQLSQHRATVDVPVNLQIVPVDVTLTIFGGGPRISGNQRAGVTYFAQALFGGARLTTSPGTG